MKTTHAIALLASSALLVPLLSTSVTRKGAPAPEARPPARVRPAIVHPARPRTSTTARR